MNGKFQIRIPSPCQENWDLMRPEEKGRHCASCQKTVVDFTGMNDDEIITQLARAGQGVCGRMAPDQLNRDLSLLPPPHMNGMKGWPLVLAGALLAGETSGPKLMGDVRVDLVEQSGVASGRPVECDRVVGKMAAVDVPDTLPVKGTHGVMVVAEEKFDTAPRLMGDTVLVSSGVFKPLKPECRELTIKDSIYTDGEIQIVTSLDSPKKRIVDTVIKWVKDSLTTIGLLPDRGLSIYPNPVRRGSVVSLSWKAEPGVYQVGLFNISGGLVQEREIVVSAKGQVNLLEIPSGVGAGVYVIRAAGVEGRSMTRELVVR